MKIDVVIPCFNVTVAQLEKAASSARRAAEVDRIIVVDDGSKTPALCRPADEVIRLDQNRGPSAARNAGAARSRADWLLFLDADDTLIPEGLAPLERLCEELGAVAGVASREVHDPTGAMRLKEPPDGWAGRALESPGDVFRPIELFSASGLMARRSLFDDGLLFDEDLRIGEDRDFLRRASDRGPIAVCETPIVRMYRDGATLTSPANLDRRVRDHLILLQRWHGKDSDAHMRDATRWLINACSKHPVSKPTWRALVQAARGHGWPVPLKCRLRKAFGGS